ncbi:EamA family transporter RarD [soil metagenome]
MSPDRRPRSELGLGVRAGLVAYVVWGLLTIYWKQLHRFNAFELIGWRIVSAAVVMAIVITVRGRWAVLAAAARNGQVVRRIALASSLLTANWGAYVYAVVHDHVIETALGYFIAPLGTMVVGVVVLGERLGTLQKAAMVLAGIAVVVMTISYGHPPVAALVIATSWTLYGLLKRQVPLSPIESFAAETFVLLIPAVIGVAVVAASATSIPRSGTGIQLSFVALSGLATAVPLILFAFAAQRVPFTMLGPMQYLVPSINLALGWALYHEAMPWVRLVGFSLVWAALVLVTIDRIRHTMDARPATAPIGPSPAR